jgi:hypothetical protein
MTGLYWSNTQYFNPRNIGGLYAWYDATDPAGNGTQPADNSSVSSWSDKSGTSKTITQGSGANQPTYKRNILNGLPVVRFNGSSTQLLNSSVASLTSNCSIFFAGTINSNSPFGGTIIEISNGAVNTGTLLFIDGDPLTTMYFRVVNGVTLYTCNYSISLPVNTVIEGSNNNSNVFIYSNNTQQDSQAGAAINTTSYLTVGALSGRIAGYFLNADVGEIIVYKSLLPTGQRNSVARYLGNKWGISVA